jgi:hypothetical protein
VAAVAWKGAVTLTPPTGWRKVSSTSGLALYAAENAPPGGPTIAFMLSASAKWVLQVSEWSDVGSTDVAAAASGGSTVGTLARTGTTSSTSASVELALGAVSALSAVSESSPTGGFVPLDLAIASNTLTLGTYVSVTSAKGPQGTSVTLSPAAKWRGVIGTFG